MSQSGPTPSSTPPSSDLGPKSSGNAALYNNNNEHQSNENSIQTNMHMQANSATPVSSDTAASTPPEDDEASSITERDTHPSKSQSQSRPSPPPPGPSSSKANNDTVNRKQYGHDKKKPNQHQHVPSSSIPSSSSSASPPVSRHYNYHHNNRRLPPQLHPGSAGKAKTSISSHKYKAHHNHHSPQESPRQGSLLAALKKESHQNREPPRQETLIEVLKKSPLPHRQTSDHFHGGQINNNNNTSRPNSGDDASTSNDHQLNDNNNDNDNQDEDGDYDEEGDDNDNDNDDDDDDEDDDNSGISRPRNPFASTAMGPNDTHTQKTLSASSRNSAKSDNTVSFDESTMTTKKRDHHDGDHHKLSPHCRRRNSSRSGQDASESDKEHTDTNNTTNSNNNDDETDHDGGSDTNSDTNTNTSTTSETLDFAKRDISKCKSRASYSQLSTLSANSAEHIIDPVPPANEEPAVYQPDDHVRIRNPASAARTRMPNAEKIGFHEPFGDNVSTSSRGNSRSGSTSSSEGLRSPHNTNTSGISRDSAGPSAAQNGDGGSGGSGSSAGGTNESGNGILSSRTSPTALEPYMPKRNKPYEPARVVLHKSELNAPYGAPNNGNNGNNGNGSNNNNGNNNGNVGFNNGVGGGIHGGPEDHSFSSVSLIASRNASIDSRSELVPQSLVMSLAGSPDGRNNGPIKHIREPKHPIYIPAVLRPTEERSYDINGGAADSLGSGSGGSVSPTPGSSARGSVASISTIPGSSAVLHSQKPVTRHWVPDKNVLSCEACHKDFTWYRRRHHCRKCGGVFCSDDVAKTIGLDRLLNFNVLGVPCKACNKCSNEFAAFCLDSPRLSDGPLTVQQPLPGPEAEEEIGDGRDWSTF